ncbi:acyl-CoA dehydrogenase family protein [Paraglaciecola sp. 2405UD69-4]|uniref:acyl-CoA dehydrogenase family protein n=1 Tax=Paraglaciecola sp. 2405UD69-4 TaxID=3391836 RepID=UPI0039C9A939
MPQYNAPLNDMQFVLHEWLKLSAHYQTLGLQDFDTELVNEILNQGAKFAEDVIAPLNREGDEQGAKLINGSVITPDGFASAYKEYIANGWNAMLGDVNYDGQDLPNTMAVPVHEMLDSANVSWRLTGMLNESAILAVTKHASDALKQTYLTKMISGEWAGTMCLTEPQAGTDLSLLSTKAVPSDEGNYRLTGSKIFISSGDQDWTDNIVHLVLARLPEAPEGVKGISLFLVPKFMPQNDGTLGARNTVTVGSIEKKMGLKGSPTCVMNFDNATGFLVGEANNGLACMFTMMNDARFQVGLQGLGIIEASYQGALTYARERLQSRAPQGIQEQSKKADPILHQPDVRKMLLTQKSISEGCRALALLYAQQMDIERFGTDSDKSKAKNVISFLTPIVKGFMTDMATEMSNLGIQVYGGHGYIREWGMEQLVRDARITQLYEGTNGIQALDLISRKLARDKNNMLQDTYDLFSNKIAEMSDSPNKTQALEILNEWQQTAVQTKQLNVVDLAASAYDFMNYSAYSLLGVIWLSMADAATQSANSKIKLGKTNTCAFFIKRILPRRDLYKTNLLDSAADLMALADNEFDYL